MSFYMASKVTWGKFGCPGVPKMTPAWGRGPGVQALPLLTTQKANSE